MTSSLSEDLTQFVLGIALDQGVLNTVRPTISADTLAAQNLIEKRSDVNLPICQQQRLNAQRYVKGWRLAQKASNSGLVFKNIDRVVSTYGITLNTMAFLPTIQMLGDDAQVEYWQKQVFAFRVIGGYGQTELGHGSNVQGLQTTAVYSPETEEFVINSPTDSSFKFWPGVLGHWATHSVVQAKTIVKGKNIGIQTFVVEIRDSGLKTLPGVEAFDLGPKLGFSRVDNGALGLHNVRVPRRGMLMRYVRVSADGTVSGLENKSAIKYGYGSMLNLRVRLTYGFAMSQIVKQAIFIHRVMERQGNLKHENNRRLIIDLLSLGYGIFLGNKHTHNTFEEYQRKLATKNFEHADELLVTCHIASATLKALSGRLGVDYQAYLLSQSKYSRFYSTEISYWFAQSVPATTYEGDNTVLLQQTAKYLLFKLDTEQSQPQRKFKSTDWEAVAAALSYIVARRLTFVKDRIQKYTDNNIPFKTYWNQKEQQCLVEIAVLWGYMTLLRGVVSTYASLQKHKEFYAKICGGMTSFFVRLIGEWEVFGFEIERVEAWKAFNDAEVQAMLEVGGIVNLPIEPVELSERKGDWLMARL